MRVSTFRWQRLLRPLTLALFTGLLLVLALQVAGAQTGSKRVGLVIRYDNGST